MTRPFKGRINIDIKDCGRSPYSALAMIT